MSHTKPFSCALKQKRSKLSPELEQQQQTLSRYKDICTDVVLDTLFSFLPFKDLKKCRLVCKAFDNAFLSQTDKWVVISKKIFGAPISQVKAANPRLFRNLTLLPRVLMRDLETVDMLTLSNALCSETNEIPIGNVLDNIPDLKFVNRLDVAATMGIDQIRDFATVVNEGRLPNLKTLSVFVTDIDKNADLEEHIFQAQSLPSLKKLILRRSFWNSRISILEQQLLNAACNLQTLSCNENLSLEGMKKLKCLKIYDSSILRRRTDVVNKGFPIMLGAVKNTLTKLEFYYSNILLEDLPVLPYLKELSISYCTFIGLNDLASNFPRLKALKIAYSRDLQQTQANLDYTTNLISKFRERRENSLKYLEVNFEQQANKENIRHFASNLSTEMRFPVKIFISTLWDKKASNPLELIMNLDTPHLIVDKSDPSEKLPKLWDQLAVVKCEKLKRGIVEFRGFDFRGKNVKILTTRISQSFIAAIKALEQSWEFVQFTNCKMHEDFAVGLRRIITENNLPVEFSYDFTPVGNFRNTCPSSSKSPYQTPFSPNVTSTGSETVKEGSWSSRLRKRT